MYYLASVIPALKRIRLPLSRDQFMLLMVSINEIFLGIDTYLAHLVSGTIRPFEWIPIIFGFTAGLVLLIACYLTLRHRDWASYLATATLSLSIIVGFMGWFFHIKRAILPNAPVLDIVSLYRLIWAPPIVAPLVFTMIGIIGISSAWVEDPVDSGWLTMWNGKRVHFPFNKTRSFFLLLSLSIIATLLSSALDHSRPGFYNPWLWLPLAAGVFGAIVPMVLGIIDDPEKGDIITYIVAMVLLGVTGVIGLWLHTQFDLTAAGQFVVERFIRGAPFLAPLLFADMAGIGLIILLDPVEHKHKLKSES
ncbi:MAG TPA: hypothetical protein VGB30_13500 [bacterium]|jgi:hypothetical protein